MAENLIQFHEAKQTHAKIHSNSTKKSWRQRENLESNERKATCHIQRSSLRMSTAFSAINSYTKRQWDNIFFKIPLTKILYPAPNVFKTREEKIPQINKNWESSWSLDLI